VITSWKLKYQSILLVSLVALGFVASSLINKAVMEKTAVNGTVYAEIVLGKDLVADILPPPEYLLES
jgi:methyl-accepting chemotaxis protein